MLTKPNSKNQEAKNTYFVYKTYTKHYKWETETKQRRENQKFNLNLTSTQYSSPLQLIEARYLVYSCLFDI